jgi:hypothetical protein
MAPKPGRNEPCHCGSGKKYKKCCLAKDEALERAAPAVARSPAPLPIDSPHDAFPRAPAPSLEAELAEARSYADPSRRLDPEFAVEELSGVVERLTKGGRAAEARALLAEIEPHQTEAFQENAAYVALWRLECALALDDGTDVEAARTLGPRVKDLPDLVDDVLHRLAWEGREEALSLLLETGLPGVREKRDEWIGSFDAEWLDRTLVVSLSRLLRKAPEVSPGDPRIQSLLATLEVKDDELTDDDVASLLRLARPDTGAGPDRKRLAVLPEAWRGGNERDEDDSEDEDTEDATTEAADRSRRFRASIAALREELFCFAAELGDKKSWPWTRQWLLAEAMFEVLWLANRRLRRERTLTLVEILLPSATDFDAAAGSMSGMFRAARHAILTSVMGWPRWAEHLVRRGLVSPGHARAQMKAFEREVVAPLRGTIEKVKDRDLLQETLLAFTSTDEWKPSFDTAPGG